MITVLNNLKLKSLELADTIKEQVSIINKLQDSVNALADIKAHVDIAISDIEARYTEMQNIHTLDSEVTQVIEQLFKLTGPSCANLNNSLNNTKENLAKEFDEALAADKVNNAVNTPVDEASNSDDVKNETSVDNSTQFILDEASNSEMSKEDVTQIVNNMAFDVDAPANSEESVAIDTEKSIDIDNDNADDLDFDISGSEASEISTNTDTNNSAPNNDIISNLAALGL